MARLLPKKIKRELCNQGGKVLNGAPGIDAGFIGTMPIRLQALTSGQLDVGNNEVEFKPAFVKVLYPGSSQKTGKIAR